MTATMTKAEAAKTAPTEEVLSNLESQYRKAADHADALRVELAANPGLIDTAIIYGEVKELKRLRSRREDLPGEIAAVEILAAKCRVALLEARLRKVRSGEAEAYARLLVLREEMGSLRERLGVADVEAGAYGSDRSFAGADLRDAQRHLEALVANAKGGKLDGSALAIEGVSGACLGRTDDRQGCGDHAPRDVSPSRRGGGPWCRGNG